MNTEKQIKLVVVVTYKDGSTFDFTVTKGAKDIFGLQQMLKQTWADRQIVVVDHGKKATYTYVINGDEIRDIVMVESEA